MQINLDNPAEVKNAINSLYRSNNIGKYIGIAKPALKILAPKIEKATGFSVNQLLNCLGDDNSQTTITTSAKPTENIYNKYKNL